jgi:hypothetical protein
LKRTSKLAIFANRENIPAMDDTKPKLEAELVDLISDTLPFRRLWYAGTNAINHAIGYAEFRSRSHDAVIRVYDEAAKVVETHEQIGEFKAP